MPSFEHRPPANVFETARTDPAQTAATTTTDSQQAATAAALVHATAGLGTDETAIAATLGGMNANERIQVSSAFTERTGDSLSNYTASKANFDMAAADNLAADKNKKARDKDPSIAKKGPSPELSQDIQGVLNQADAARTGANPELQIERQMFEKAVALSPEAEAAFAPTLDMMTSKTLAYMRAMHGDGEGGIDAAALTKLGKDPTQRNYAGAVGTNTQDLLAVLGGGVGEDGKALPRGNTREVMVALSEFQDKILGPDTLAEGGLDRMRAAFGEGGAAAGGAFGLADIERLGDRKDQYLSELKTGKTPDAKGLFSPLGGAAGPHAGYLAAKGQEMDTKLPSFSAEAIAAQFGPEKAAELNGASASGVGEASILSRTGLTMNHAQEAGYNLSQREINHTHAANAATGQGERLLWNVGGRANMVDPNAPFIADANAQSMPLKAGISGTTARGMGLFDALGADPTMGRLALMSQLNSIEAHSWHEIASAAQGYVGADSPNAYNVATPYSGMGLSVEQMRTIADRKGVSFDDINKNS